MARKGVKDPEKSAEMKRRYAEVRERERREAVDREKRDANEAKARQRENVNGCLGYLLFLFMIWILPGLLFQGSEAVGRIYTWVMLITAISMPIVGAIVSLRSGRRDDDAEIDSLTKGGPPP